MDDTGGAIVAGDEEDQQQKVLLLAASAILDELQTQMRELKHKTDQTEHDVQIGNNIIELQEQKILDLQNKMQIQLDDMQHEITQLKQQHVGTSSTTTTAAAAGTPSSNAAHNPPPSNTLTSSSSPTRSSNFFQRNITHHDGLPQDTFTLMMISPFYDRAWSLGSFTFAFQIVLISMIAANQLQESIMSSAFNVPFKVDPVVRAGQ